MDVIFTPRAERQIDDLHRYIAERSGFESRADGYIQRIVDFCLGLPVAPLRGAARDDILPGLRTVGFERRVTVAFMVLSDRILIEGIFYGGRQVEGEF